MGRKAGPPTRMVRVTVEAAEVLAGRAQRRRTTIAEYVTELLESTPAGPPLPQPAVPTVDLLVNERTQKPAAPPPSSQATAYGGRRCRCKSPVLSKVVTNICTACGLLRRP